MVHSPLGTDSINLVNEDDTWRVVLRDTEQLANEFRSISEILLDEF